MPDVFDEVTGTGKEDIFDQITSPTPATDRAVAAPTPAPPPPPMSTLGGVQKLFEAGAGLITGRQPAMPGELPDHSQQWNQEQAQMRADAAQAGLPNIPGGRDRLIDAITRSEAAGYPVPHKIGLPDEPTGDYAPTMDLQNLVNALKEREKRDPSVAKERAYWENELRSGMFTPETPPREEIKATDYSDPYRALSELGRAGEWLMAGGRRPEDIPPSPPIIPQAAAEYGIGTLAEAAKMGYPPLRAAAALLPPGVGQGAKEALAENISGFSQLQNVAGLVGQTATMGPVLPILYGATTIAKQPEMIGRVVENYRKHGLFAPETVKAAVDMGIQDVLGALALKAGPRAVREFDKARSQTAAEQGAAIQVGVLGRLTPPTVQDLHDQILNLQGDVIGMQHDGLAPNDPRLVAAQGKVDAAQKEWIAAIEAEHAKEAQAEEPPAPAAPAETAYQQPGAAAEAPAPTEPVGPTGPQIRVSSQTQPVPSAFAEQAVPINWAAVRTAREESRGLGALTEAAGGLVSWEDTKPLIEEFQKVRRSVPGINDQQAAELAMLKLNVSKATKANQGTAKAVLDEAVQRIGGEIRRATQEGQQQIGGQPEYQGVPQGENLPAYPEQVRETGRGQAGGGGGAGAGPEVAPPEAPVVSNAHYVKLIDGTVKPINPFAARMEGDVLLADGNMVSRDAISGFLDADKKPITQQIAPITREQYKELRHKRAAGEVISPEEHEQIRQYEGAAAQGKFGAVEAPAAPTAEPGPVGPPPVAGPPTGFVPGAADVHLGAPGGVRSPETEAANAKVLEEIARQEREDFARHRAEEAALQAELFGKTAGMKKIIADADNNGVTLTVHLGEKRGDLHAFYERLGFKETGRDQSGIKLQREPAQPPPPTTAKEAQTQPAKPSPPGTEPTPLQGGVGRLQEQNLTPEQLAENARVLAAHEKEFPAQSIAEQFAEERAVPAKTIEKAKSVARQRAEAARRKREAQAEAPVRHDEFAKPGYTAVTPARPPPTPEELRYGPREPGQPPPLPAQPPPLPAQPPPLPPPLPTAPSQLALEKAAAADVGPQVWANMKQERLKNPNASLRVYQSLAKNPRAANPTEWAHMNQRLIDLEREQADALTDRNANPNDALAKDKVDQLNQDIIDHRDLMARTRSANGPPMTAAELLDANRMTPARMRAEAQALANDGRPLSENPELAKFTDETAKGLEEVNKNIADAQAHQMFEQVLKESRTEARVTEAKLEPKKPFLQDAYDKAQARMQERFKEGEQFFSGIVPDPALIRDQAIIGAYHIGRGLTKFADWSRAVAKDIGQKSADYMQELFARSKQYHLEASKALNQPSKLTKAEIKEMTALTRTEKQISQLQKGQAPAARPGPRAAPLDPFLRKQLAKKAQLTAEWNARLAKERWKQLPLAQRAFVRATGVGQEIQTIRSAFDVSGVLRQGGVLAAGHWGAAGKALGAMAEAAKWGRRGELAAHEVMTDIENHPLNVEDNVIKRGGLELTDPFADEYGGLKNTQKEEAFKGVLAKKIPGVNWSDRTFHVFLNKLRSESYYALINQLEKITGRKATDGELKVLANYVNIASGRGATGGWVKSFEGMSKILWSPRLLMSRLQLLSLQPLWRGITHDAAPFARALIAKEYAASLSTLALALSLGGMAGAVVDLDRRSKDFGKLRFGNTRIDLMASLQQPFVLGNQLISGQQVTSKGKVIPIRGKGKPYGAPGAWELMSRFARAKATPALGIGINVAQGETITGQPTSPINEALTSFLPLSPSDVMDAMQAQGVPVKVAASMLAMMGAGVGTYRPVTGAEKADYQETLERRDRALLHGDIPKAAHLTRKLWKGPY